MNDDEQQKALLLEYYSMVAECFSRAMRDTLLLGLLVFGLFALVLIGYATGKL